MHGVGPRKRNRSSTAAPAVAADTTTTTNKSITTAAVTAASITPAGSAASTTNWAPSTTTLPQQQASMRARAASLSAEGDGANTTTAGQATTSIVCDQRRGLIPERCDGRLAIACGQATAAVPARTTARRLNIAMQRSSCDRTLVKPRHRLQCDQHRCGIAQRCRDIVRPPILKSWQQCQSGRRRGGISNAAMIVGHNSAEGSPPAVREAATASSCIARSNDRGLVGGMSWPISHIITPASPLRLAKRTFCFTVMTLLKK